MRKKFESIILLTIILFSISVQASISEINLISELETEAGEIEWERTFGTNGDETGEYIVATSDGGFAIMGFSGPNEARYYLIIKTDASGNMEWSKTYKTTDIGSCFLACGFIQTQDGGYAISAGKGDYLKLEKFNSTGDFQWYHEYGMIGDEREYSNAVIQTQDGSYVLAGATNGSMDFYSAYIVKTDSNGNELWNQSYGTNVFDILGAIQQTSDGGFILGGFSYTKEFSQDILLIRTDSNGNVIWHKTYGGTPSERLMSVLETDDKGFIVGGITETNSNQGDYLLMKVDSAGNLKWNKSFGGPLSECNFDWPGACSLIQTSDGGFAFIGNTKSFSKAGGFDIWLIKTDANGNAVWDNTYGTDSNENTKSLVQTADGGIVFVATKDSGGAGDYDVWLVKIKGSFSSLTGTKDASSPTGKASPISSWPTIIALAFVSLIVYKKRRINKNK